MKIQEIVWVGIALFFFAGTYLVGLGVTQGSAHLGEANLAPVLVNCATVSVFLMLAVTSAITLVFMRKRAGRSGTPSHLVLVAGVFLFLHGVLTTGFMFTLWSENYIFYFMDLGLVVVVMVSLVAWRKRAMGDK